MMSDTVPEHNTDWIDISVPIRNGIVHWPGDPQVRIELLSSLDRGDACNLSSLAMSVHTATHIDAPLHMLAGGASMDNLPLSALIGPARVIEVVGPRLIGPEDLIAHSIKPAGRILLKTTNSQRCWTTDAFVEDYVSLSAAGAQYLVDRGVRAVGIDYLSIGQYSPAGDAPHKILMEAGIWIVEGLDLSKVRAGAYDLICLPLRLLGAEGAPARAILRPAGPA